MEQSTESPSTNTTNRLLQKLYDIRDMILEILNKKAQQRKQEIQRRKEYKKLKASMERQQ